MVGHYKGTEHENTIFKTTIPHELTHLHLGKNRKIRLEPGQYEAYKFFDEGVAIQSSYRLIPEANAYFVKFRNTAHIIHKYTDHSLPDIMNNWLPEDEVNGMSYYDYTCAFVNFLDAQITTKTCRDFFVTWNSQKEIRLCTEFFEHYYHLPLAEMQKLWDAELENWAADSVFVNKSVIRKVDDLPDGALFEFETTQEIKPDSDIYCIYQNRLLKMDATSYNQYRFLDKGRFALKTTTPINWNEITFIVLMGNRVELLTGVTNL
jgi:hypothetical protein